MILGQSCHAKLTSDPINQHRTHQQFCRVFNPSVYLKTLEAGNYWHTQQDDKWYHQPDDVEHHFLEMKGFTDSTTTCFEK